MMVELGKSKPFSLIQFLKSFKYSILIAKTHAQRNELWYGLSLMKILQDAVTN